MGRADLPRCMMGLHSRCSAFLHRVVTRNGFASARETGHRRLAFVSSIVGMVISLLGIITSPNEGYGLMMLPQVVCVASSTAIFGALFWKREIPEVVYNAWLALLHACLVVLDLGSKTRPTSFEVWPTYILVIDTVYLFDLHTNIGLPLLAVSSFWLLLCGIEGSVRFGLYDMPGTPSQALRRKESDETCFCEALPCGYSRAWNKAVLNTLFLLGCCAITKMFAANTQRERAQMQLTIDCVERIAKLLSDYDVEGCAAALQDCRAALPEDIYQSLANLEANLRSYRKYLPEYLLKYLQEHMSISRNELACAPGLQDNHAALMFTDIRRSTSLWEDAPDAMVRALATHNNRMRHVIQVCNGYEVKTVGDSFMVAFASVTSAVECGLKMHEALYHADWPQSLLDLPLCRESDVWRGLTVRIGINSGPVTHEENLLTSRVDYFGPTVNVAARLEALCLPGAVVLLTEQWGPASAQITADTVTGAPEVVKLAGVTGSFSVTHLWPASLAGRVQNPLDSRDQSPQSLTGRVRRSQSPLSISGSLPSVLRPSYSTVGVAQLGNGEARGILAHVGLNRSLQNAMHALGRTYGTLVTVVGCNIVVGWNIAKVLEAHTESALRFVRLMRRLPLELEAVGLCTGSVHHGDLGSTQQRFVTVVGDVVRFSWRLCNIADKCRLLCLYAAPEVNDIPSCLRPTLDTTEIEEQDIGPVYALSEMAGSEGAGTDFGSQSSFISSSRHRVSKHPTWVLEQDVEQDV